MRPVVGFDATPAVRQRAGIGRYTRQLLASLSARSSDYKFKLYYAARGDQRGHLPELSHDFQSRALPVSDRVLNALWQRARVPLPVQAAIGRFDLFHSPDFTLPPTAGRPSVLTIHDLAFVRVPDCAFPTLREYLARVVPRSARRATAVIAVSESTRRDVIDICGVAPDRVWTVPEGVDGFFHPVSSGETERIMRRLGIDRPFLLAVGTLEPRKNYSRLLEAFAQIRRRAPDHVLVIAGGYGWMYAGIFERLLELGLRDHVVFLQPDDQTLRALYNRAEALAYVSLYEGFGLPALEALACGCPTVCSGTSSLPEVVGDCALLVDPVSSESIAEGIERVLEDSSLQQRLRSGGPSRARHFSWDRAAVGTVEVYRRVLA